METQQQHDFTEIATNLRGVDPPESIPPLELGQLEPLLIRDVSRNAADAYHLTQGAPDTTDSNILKCGRTSIFDDGIRCAITVKEEGVLLLGIFTHEEEVVYQVSFAPTGENEWELITFHMKPGCEDPMESGVTKLLLNGVESFLRRLASLRLEDQRLVVDENQLHNMIMLLNRGYEAAGHEDQRRIERILEGDQALDYRIIPGANGLEVINVMYESDEEFAVNLARTFLGSNRETAPEITESVDRIRDGVTVVTYGGKEPHCPIRPEISTRYPGKAHA